MLEKLNVEGEKLGAWRELIQGGGEQDRKRKCDLQQKRKSAFIPELKELGQVALSVNQWVGRCKSWGCRIERNQNHTMGNLEAFNFLNLCSVCIFRAKTRHKLVPSKTLQRMAAMAGKGMGHRTRLYSLGEWMGRGKWERDLFIGVWG